ncbi:putative ATP synthase 24 kDa subunit [Hibiscus syriacus]|uniref:ATP synthase 24 kDa subunit n=1 Tax=Hibiscus syriacus TaxID=106335 RepID=A0A6A3CHQ4_HIBSY|nr:putative ATP synthase 24 kDa subunit [Hibiscus syriacus]
MELYFEVANCFGETTREKVEKGIRNALLPLPLNFYAKIYLHQTKLFSESQRIQYTIQTRTQDIPYARTYLLTLKDIRIKRGLTDDLGAEAMMDALDKIEKEIKKPLMRNEKKSMALLTAEFDKTNKQLGIRKEDLPKYEEQLELKIAKAQLEELKKDALEAMETQTKRYVNDLMFCYDGALLFSR